ncbi:MAG: hypothetical protein AAF614_18920 [Chloroflexota bacterium]
MNLKTSQAEFRRAYLNGGVGAIISGIVWIIASLTQTLASIGTGFAVLFLGGMLIFPLTVAFLRAFTNRSLPSEENPGGRMVIETLFPMIAMFFAAWLILPMRPEFVMPLAAIAVGAHYFGFRSAYGDILYWILGGLMCVLGVSSILYSIPSSTIVPYIVAIFEIAFGILLISRADR